MDFTTKINDDILLSIFSHLVELPCILPPFVGEPSLTLVVVCRRWRQIILNSPSMWTNLFISPTVYSNKFNANINLNCCWLQLDIRRHSGHWLHLSLVHYSAPSSPQNTDSGNKCKAEINVLENVIFPAARRAKCLSLTFCSNDTAETFLTTPRSRFYFLESVEICLLNCTRSEVPPTAVAARNNLTSITVFQNLPFLRHASIIINNGLNPLSLQMPWYQLTRINMGFMTIPPKVFMSILSKSSPCLSEGFFTIKFLPKKRSSPSSPNRHQHPRVFAPALKHLRLRLINPSLEPDVFSRIRFPALVSFRADLDDTNAGWMLTTYHPLFCNSAHTLEMIEFWDLLSPEGLEGVERVHLHNPRRNFPQMQQDFDKLFSTIPKVRILHLPVGLFIPGAVAERIAQGSLLPRLEILEVASYTGVDILTMITERNELAYHRPELVGSSSAASMTGLDTESFLPPFFSEVVLLTSVTHMTRVKRRMASMQSLSSSQTTNFRVLFASQSLF